MYHLSSQIFPSLQTIKIVGNTNDFKNWLKTEHPDTNSDDLFEGYRFAVTCCINAFLDGLSHDQILEIKNDFLLDNAISRWAAIHSVKATCEKTVFLKNLKPIVKRISKSNNYSELEQSLIPFNNMIISKFDFIFNNCIGLSSKIKIDKTIASKLLLIDFAHTYMVQINNNGPAANSTNVVFNKWTKQELKEKYLHGYSYSVQFLWYSLLGEEQYNKTQLTKMHLSDSWRKYKLIETEKSGNPIIDSFSEKYNLNEQTCFDSYFYWIQKEITEPLSKQHGFQVYSINSYFTFLPQNYNKIELWSELLDITTLDKDPALSFGEKMEQLLYWYPFDLIGNDKSALFSGIASFNTMLAGTVTLHKKKVSEFEKIIVAKFTHPHLGDAKKNDYSYGILVDSQSSAGHYSSGWIIYKNACGDYSGFSGSEHKTAEMLITKYLKKDKIELRELTVPLSKFEKYINEHILDNKQLSILQQNKLIPDIIQKSRAYAFELFTYWVCALYYKGYTVSLNTDKNSIEGEKDVVIQNENEVILIECKLNPQNYNMAEILDKLERKVKGYPQKNKHCQIWFWYIASSKNQAILDKAVIEGRSVKVITVSNSKEEKILKGISLESMKGIMRNYKETDLEADKQLDDFLKQMDKHGVKVNIVEGEDSDVISLG